MQLLDTRFYFKSKVINVDNYKYMKFLMQKAINIPL